MKRFWNIPAKSFSILGRRGHAGILLTLLLLVVYNEKITAARLPQLPPNVHRVLFLGASITYAGQYVTDIEAYYITHYPQLHIEFMNAGLPSETVSGLSEPGHAGGRFPRPDLHERLKRVLAITKPDLVFTDYGINDGIYMPLDEQRFQKFKDGINWLQEEIVKTGARIIFLTPTVFDEQTGKIRGYANVIDLYSDWLLSRRYVVNWEVVDIHWPMTKYLQDQRRNDSSFTFAKDGVHPDDLGHWLMAQQILLYLGEKEVLNAGDIKTAIKDHPAADRIFQLVSERQSIMKDAWLTAAGHKRPDMNKGLPIEQARIKYAEIEKQIIDLNRVAKESE
jgi:lysophospholipase L1-like esterase